MHVRPDWGVEVLNAANRAQKLTLEIMNSPRDPWSIREFFDVAVTIDEAGSALGISELNNLGVRLVHTAKSVLLSKVSGSQLNSTVSQLLAIAEELNSDTSNGSATRTCV